MIPKALQPLAVPVTELHLSETNPRRGDVAAVVRSLDRFGQRVPIVYRWQSPRPRARKQKVVIAGNHRLQAALELGWSEIAAVDADDLSPAEAKAFALADNRTADLAVYDDEMLLAQLLEMDAELLESTSWTEDEVKGLEFLKDQLTNAGSQDPMDEWKGLPDYSSEDRSSHWSCRVHFASEADVEAFFELIGRPRHQILWWPEDDPYSGGTTTEKKWVSD